MSAIPEFEHDAPPRIRLDLLNVGCGVTCHSDWTNIDGFVMGKGVLACDIKRGLPFPDQSFDACYASHVLEHLTPDEAARLLAEMYRVLRPDGIVRLAVPDMERIARDYLAHLGRALDGAHGADDDYDWMMIQLLDQSVRRIPGGAMSEFWRDTRRQNLDFVIARAGMEAEQAIARARGDGEPPRRRSLFARMRLNSLARLCTQARRRVAGWCVRLIAGRDASAAYREGLFRNSGEIHQWMYDRYSLARVLLRAGFSRARVCRADESRIPDFARYELDIVQGRVRKPDSLYMEASKSPPSIGGVVEIAPHAAAAAFKRAGATMGARASER